MTQKVDQSGCAACSEKDNPKKQRRRYSLPKTIAIPLTVKALNVQDIKNYLHVSQGTVLRWFRRGELTQLLSVRGSYTSREHLKEFLKKRGCLVVEEQPTQTDPSIE